ncbi:MAG: hypothetical protein COA58_11775 [Bacteroidetes bacterium]|nr:MAG: hypothetical protein COA58_11775 [Bacteroidota bacterium]
MKVYLLGYIPPFYKKKHTNFWPWNYLTTTFNELGYEAEHINASKINFKKPAIFICWNAPDSIELIEKYKPHKDSVIIQKLTSFDASKESEGDWTDDPLTFFKNWHWPQYKKLDYLAKSGYRYYAFGAKSDIETFPVKSEIVNRHADRIFWIPWGTMTLSYDKIMQSEPIMNGFEYDAAFVGSKWGTATRGNIKEWERYLQPVLDASENTILAGRGTKVGAVSVSKHVEFLEKSRLCPIIHATSWKVEKGIMDRFWTVFSLGRFGVVDNEGVLDFYNENEVVLEMDPDEYISKSIYYMNNVEKQLPYIQAIQKRIKTEYNQHEVWKKILNKISNE